MTNGKITIYREKQFVVLNALQIQFMEENLTDLEVVTLPSDFSYKENDDGTARIFNMCLKSKEYRKIRLTYYDVGKECQVFNSLWYPDVSQHDANLPVLGVDLLSFNDRKRNLAVVDFQPVIPVPICKNNDNNCSNSSPATDPDNKAVHAIPPLIEKKLSFLRRKYPSLHGHMSKRFYDENQFFSKQMLLQNTIPMVSSMSVGVCSQRIRISSRHMLKWFSIA